MLEHIGRRTALTTAAEPARFQSHVTWRPSEEISVLVISSDCLLVQVVGATLAKQSPSYMPPVPRRPWQYPN
jgi:hypothetical protein